MATFDSIAEEYALKIKNSVKKSGLTKSASLLKATTEQQIISSALKEINEDIKRYTVDGKSLTENQLETIFNLVGKKLGLSKPEKIQLMLKEASNDNFLTLTNYWSSFYGELEL